MSSVLRERGGHARVRALDPSSYVRHAIHGSERIWPETNCYSDVIIELLHGLGHEPIAGLGFAVAADFEEDQWTFFKFPDHDIEALYGLSIQELAVWRNLIDHIMAQVDAGHPVLVELDSYFLPDTSGTAYRLAHTKSTVAVNEIDVEREYLGYFHNQSYFALEGQDFRDVFQTTGLVHERMLPPYIEYVKHHPRFIPLSAESLVECSWELGRSHIRAMPEVNPFTRFRERFEADLSWLLAADLSTFHAYSFATLRQFGACFELAHTYCQWLAEHRRPELKPAGERFLEIARAAKDMQFQLARSMARKRPLDLAPLREMGEWWEDAAERLSAIAQ